MIIAKLRSFAGLAASFVFCGLVAWLICTTFASSASAAAFRISRPYPIPPKYIWEFYYWPTITYDNGQYLVYYEGYYSDSLGGFWSQVFATRVSPQGQVLDTIPVPLSLWTNGWVCQNGILSVLGPATASDGFFTLWGRINSSPSDTVWRILGSRIRQDGTLIDSVGLPPVNQLGEQINYSCVRGDSLYLLIWEDRRKGYLLTYGARIREDRSALDPDGFRVNLVDTVPTVDGETALAYNGNVFLAVWGWGVLGSNDRYVRAARVREDGVVLDTVPIKLTPGPASRRRFARTPIVAADGQNFFVAFLYEDSIRQNDYVAGVRVSGSGVVLDSIPFRISKACTIPSYVGLTFNGWDYQVVWNGEGGDYVYGARVSPSGVVKDTIQGRLFPTSPSSQYSPFLSTAPDGKSLVVWTNRNNSNGGIYGAFLDTTGREVGVEELEGPSGERSLEVCLAQPHPNPMRNQGEVAFSLPALAKAHLAVYDALGRKVKVLLDGRVEAGPHALAWDGRDGAGRLLPSGVYFLRLEAGGVSLTRKLVVLR